jgi:hypothetical protein
MATLANPGVASQAAFGQLGSTHIVTQGIHVPPSGRAYVVITCLEDVTFTTLTAEDATEHFSSETPVADPEGVGSSVTTSTIFPKGITIYGRYSGITLNSGKVLAYHGPSSL